MHDDVLINKAATIERCVARARKEYFRDPGSFGTDFTRQDAAILNIQRACEAALGGFRTWSVESENWPQRGQFLPDLQPHSPAMGQKDGVLEERRSQKWTAAADLQPTISKSDSLLDMGQHLIRRERLGVPQSARDVFALLAQGGWIAPALADGLKRMVGFRNIAVHDYKALQLPITVAIIEKHLDEFLQYSQAVLLGRPNA